MREDHLLLCGDVPLDCVNGASPHRLVLGKGNDQIHFDPNALNRKIVQELPPILHDLLDIAVFVYVGDQMVSRGRDRSFDYGEKWHRCLFFRIPVREYDVWSNPEITDLLNETLSFSSGETFRFKFWPLKQDRFSEYLPLTDDIDSGRDYDKVLMFSGGLDSFVGAVDEVTHFKSRAVLVSHQSHNRMKSLQRNLFKYVHSIGETCNRPLHIPIGINKGKTLTRETSQRTRSFLFATLGVVIARVFGLNRTRFYENGIVSCNLSWDGQALQARSTRSTHPRLLNLLSRLVSAVTGQEFLVENPYFNRTKTEVCSRLVELLHESKIEETRSCAKSIHRNPHTHCGICSQCVDRRFATLAAQCADHDPDWRYALNIFTDGINAKHERAMALGYTGSAKETEAMTPEGFIRKFSSEVSEAARYLGGTSIEEGMHAIYLLHRRHAESVNDVMVNKVKENAAALYRNQLPKTCLLRMAFSEHDVAKLISADGTKRHAKGKLQSEVKTCLDQHPKWKARQIAEKIGNTTDAAVRQTQAWKTRPNRPKKKNKK